MRQKVRKRHIVVSGRADRSFARIADAMGRSKKLHRDNDWKIALVTRTIGAERGRAARGRPAAI